MITRVYIKKGNETTLKNFRKRENADKYFWEQERDCGAGTRLIDSGTNYKLSTGVCTLFHKWENGDSIELISYNY